MTTPLRIDPEQRFSCASCGRCCHRFDVVVSAEEVELYRRRNAAGWFRETDGAAGSDRDPFEAIAELPGLQRIRKRADGACGFLSAANRCRIHEELGAARKPLTCRLFPYAFHPTRDGVVVTASFSCPTVIANQGAAIVAGEPRAAIESLRQEWFATRPLVAAPAEFVKGRTIDAGSSRLLRESLLTMLRRDSADIRENIARIAHALDDLTRSRVLALPDADFSEYLSLTLPHAAAKSDAPPKQLPGRVGRLLQYGFLYVVAATRAAVERRGQSRLRLRLVRMQLLAHFHGLAPGTDRVSVRTIRHVPVDINAAEIRPIVFHYLRSTLETLGGRGLPLLDELAIAVSLLNAACGLAAMNAHAAGRAVDRQGFSDALMEASDLRHAADSALFVWILSRLADGTEALWCLTRAPEMEPS